MLVWVLAVGGVSSHTLPLDHAFHSTTLNEQTELCNEGHGLMQSMCKVTAATVEARLGSGGHRHNV